MGQPRFITDPSYDALHNAAVAMVREARTYGVIDAVIAPVRGGLMFGVIASHTLNVPVIPVAYSSKSGAGDDKNHLNQLPLLSPDVKTILIVDDIIDSGHTLKEIVEHYKAFPFTKVMTAVFHYKVGAVFVPDLYFWLIPADSGFINYPYEAV